MAARTQWWKNGDAPGDEIESVFDPEDGQMKVTPGKVVKPYEPSSKADHVGTDLCGECGQAFEVHGKLGKTLVHPGDFIVTKDGGSHAVERPVNPVEAAAAEIAAAEVTE